MALKDFAGGAVGTTLAADITSGDTSATIAAATGWPSGGASGTFGIAIGNIDPVSGRFTTNVEKIRVTSRTGTTLSSLTRGIDGTSAVAHVTGETVRHILLAEDIDEVNAHMFDTGRDDHTQYHTAARHAAVVHTAAMLGTDSVGTDEIAAGAVGSAELATGAVIAGKIAAGGISAASQFAAGVVDAAAIATDAVGSAEIAADAVGSSEIAAGAVGSGELATGAVIAGKIASGGVSSTAEVADAIITMAKFASETGVDWSSSIVWTNVTLGTGGVKYARYWKFGRLVVMLAGFQLGTGGNVTGGLAHSLPFTTASFTGFTGTSESGGLSAATARDASAPARWSGIGIVQTSDDTATDWVVAGAANGWGSVTPFDWAATDSMSTITIYEATS